MKQVVDAAAAKFPEEGRGYESMGTRLLQTFEDVLGDLSCHVRLGVRVRIP